MKIGEFERSILQEGRKTESSKKPMKKDFVEVLDLGQSRNMVGDDGFASGRKTGSGTLEDKGRKRVPRQRE